jgi:ABC-type transporter MlaC component
LEEGMRNYIKKKKMKKKKKKKKKEKGNPEKIHVRCEVILNLKPDVQMDFSVTLTVCKTIRG